MTTHKPLCLAVFLTCLSLLSLPSLTNAGDVLTVKNIGMELARDLANKAVMICRDMGHQVSAVVVDRNGNVRSVLRDDLASRFTLQLAEEKANATILSGISSSEFRKNRGDIRPELNHMDDLVVLEGALPINAGGYRVGALGVSGASGGDIDEVCARKALDAFKDRLEFAAD